MGCGVALEAGFLGMIGLGNLTDRAGWYVGLTWGLFLLFGLSCWLLIKQAGKAGQREWLFISLFFAALFRLTTLFAAPTLSTDQFRYTWEGRLVTQGVSPYRYAPDDPALLKYRSEIWPLVQQRETASPYPPLAQLIGAGEYLLFGESLLGPKIAAIVFDGLTCLALLWLLGIYGLDKRRIILYAWCPLPIIEFGQSGHNDAPMLFLLLMAIGLAERRKPTLSALALGLACLAKFTPIFGLPLFLVVWHFARSGKGGQAGWNWRTALSFPTWAYPFLTGLVIVGGYLPFLFMGQGAIGSILEYTGSWRDNEGLVYGILADWISPMTAKGLSIAVVGGTILLLSFHPTLAISLSLPRRLMLLFGVVLLVASTVHPWYLSWVLVLLPLVYLKEPAFKAWDNGWLLFAALVQLVYLAYAGDGSPYIWVKPLEYWPLYLFIGWSLLKSKRSASTNSIINKLKENQVKNDSIN